MNVIIVPSGTRSSRSTCVTFGQLAAMALAGLVVLPLVVGYVVKIGRAHV